MWTLVKILEKKSVKPKIPYFVYGNTQNMYLEIDHWLPIVFVPGIEIKNELKIIFSQFDRSKE